MPGKRLLILLLTVFTVAIAHPLFAASKEKVLHNFKYDGKDGIYPYASLISDAAGNLYGTTAGGGAYDYGTVFQLEPGPNGTWTEIVLHSFDFKHGAYP